MVASAISKVIQILKRISVDCLKTKTNNRRQSGRREILQRANGKAARSAENHDYNQALMGFSSEWLEGVSVQKKEGEALRYEGQSCSRSSQYLIWLLRVNRGCFQPLRQRALT